MTELALVRESAVAPVLEDWKTYIMPPLPPSRSGPAMHW